MRDLNAPELPVVAHTGEHWHTPDVEALAAELAAAGYIELPPTRAFMLRRLRWDSRRTFVNIRQDGRIRVGGDAPEDAAALLEQLARQRSEEVPS